MNLGILLLNMFPNPNLPVVGRLTLYIHNIAGRGVHSSQTHARDYLSPTRKAITIWSS